MVSPTQYFPIPRLFRQARANLAAPTASFEGRTVLLTGGTGVICAEAARILVGLGVERLVLGVPNVGKEMETARNLAEELQRMRISPPQREPTSPASQGGQKEAEQQADASESMPATSETAVKPLNVLIWELDLTSFASVKAFAAQANGLSRLDVALMGAGKYNKTRRVTTDGWEETLQLMHLSTALLEVLLLPALIRSAKEYGTVSVLSSVASFGIAFAAPLLNTVLKKLGQPKSPNKLLKELSAVRDPHKSQQYGVIKLVHLHFVRALAERLGDADRSRIVVHSVDPGATKTPLTSASKAALLLGTIVFRSHTMCARTVANSCIPLEDTQGSLLIDYDVVPYPPFMVSEKGQVIARLIWEETTDLLRELSPEAKVVLDGLKHD